MALLQHLALRVEKGSPMHSRLMNLKEGLFQIGELANGHKLKSDCWRAFKKSGIMHSRLMGLKDGLFQVGG